MDTSNNLSDLENQKLLLDTNQVTKQEYPLKIDFSVYRMGDDMIMNTSPQGLRILGSDMPIIDKNHQQDITHGRQNKSSDQNDNLKENQNQEKMKFCEVCYIDHSIQEFISVPFCGHMFCQESLQCYFTFQITQSGKFHLKCPQNKCGQEITQDFLNQILGSDTLKKHEEFKLNHEVSDDPNRIFCPIANCGQVIRVDNHSNAKKIKCESCENDICFSCKAQWHQGKSCAKYQSDLYKGWVFKMDAHVCPNCKVPIEKNEGCNYMHCTKCEYNWCWVCGEKLTDYQHYFTPLVFIRCTAVPKNCKSKCKFHSKFICVILFFPILLFLALTFLITFRISNLITGKLPTCEFKSKIVSVIMFPVIFVYFFILFSLLISIVYGCTILIFPFILCPALYWNVSKYCKISKYWSNNRRIDISQRQAPPMIEQQLDQNDLSTLHINHDQNKGDLEQQSPYLLRKNENRNNKEYQMQQNNGKNQKIDEELQKPLLQKH
eukprot:403337484